MKSAATDCDLRVYADDTCFLFSDENVSSIEKHLNVDFNSLCEWFIDNKLSIHLGEEKTKYILCKKGKKRYLALFEYLGCLLDEKMSGESIAKGHYKKLIEKQIFFVGRIGTYHTIYKECYATP